MEVVEVVVEDFISLAVLDKVVEVIVVVVFVVDGKQSSMLTLTHWVQPFSSIFGHLLNNSQRPLTR